MINKFLLSTVALAALAGTAFAADLPSRHAPPVYVPPPIPVFTWTGVYVGGQVGYEFGKDSNDLNPSSTSTSGVIGGAHIGYNYQLPNNFVVGLEGDVEGTSARGTTTYAFGPGYYKEGIQGSVRGRVGYAVDRALFYATGGAAFGGINNNYYGVGEDSPSHTRIGYTVGGGIEYAIDHNWSVRAEYRYTDFGHTTDYLTNSDAGAAVRKHDSDNKVEAGFSYKFDTFGPTPVVARY
ncbi:MAG: outer membrane protein [Beijerinckiaceae bacterium]